MEGLEEIRDINHHLLCCADAYRGTIEKKINKTEHITVYMPVGGAVRIVKGIKSLTIVRDGACSMRVTGDLYQCF